MFTGRNDAKEEEEEKEKKRNQHDNIGHVEVPLGEALVNFAGLRHALDICLKLKTRFEGKRVELRLDQDKTWRKTDMSRKRRKNR
ncbi:unnamed protein product [Nippostrongylus brasiliensis]|uniref:Costars domain-containing protein n=1 Tax=Nippostrongylus brasiliensis TaxID=27835 RepID=A0A0N4XL83_NIPBR|nr:unnamed protein product [Nippostrongylus brasiliensis]